MMTSKKTDMKRSLILSLVLDQAQKIAKSDGNRDPVDKDIEDAACKLIKLAEQSKAAGMSVDRDIEVFNEFVPRMLSETELKHIIDVNIDAGHNFPTIMKNLKKYRCDMKVASGLVKEMLK